MVAKSTLGADRVLPVPSTFSTYARLITPLEGFHTNSQLIYGVTSDTIHPHAV